MQRSLHLKVIFDEKPHKEAGKFSKQTFFIFFGKLSTLMP